MHRSNVFVRVLILPVAFAAMAVSAPAVRVAPFAAPPILMYHRIDAPDRRGGTRTLTVAPGALAQQLQYLRKQRLAVLSMAQLEERLRQGKALRNDVVLTFDDGYADQILYAVPLLRRFGDSATFYVVSGTVGTHAHVTWTSLRQVAAQGFDIAPHGLTHDDLSLMSRAHQKKQIDGSVRSLHLRLHVRSASYAYPAGRFTRQTMQLVRSAGVPLAVTTDRRYVLAPQTQWEMPRLRVNGTWSLSQFERALQWALVHRVLVQR